MSGSGESVPIACNLGALSPEERTRRSGLAARLSDRVRERKELDQGYALRLDSDPESCEETLSLVLLERRCCPFLHFELELDPGAGPIWLRITGEPGVKEFLAATIFGELTPDRRC